MVSELEISFNAAFSLGLFKLLNIPPSKVVGMLDMPAPELIEDLLNIFVLLSDFGEETVVRNEVEFNVEFGVCVGDCVVLCDPKALKRELDLTPTSLLDGGGPIGVVEEGNIIAATGLLIGVDAST